MKKLVFIMVILTACGDSTQYETKNGSYFLKDQLNQIEGLIDQEEKLNTAVSSASVAWHLDHMLKTINSISDSLSQSDPTEFEGSYNFLRTIVFFRGKIPRGVAQSPASVRPPEIILEENILKQLSIARDKVKEIIKLDQKAHFNHPRFEQLNRNQTLQFLEIHTNHHLDIIDDILNGE